MEAFLGPAATQIVAAKAEHIAGRPVPTMADEARPLSRCAGAVKAQDASGD